jgi:polyisoprenoid-binding protein YceI
MTGDFTLRGVTKTVDFDLEFLGTGPSAQPGVTMAGFEAKTEIDRRDFNVNFDATLENGGLVVGNKITLELNIEISKAD